MFESNSGESKWKKKMQRKGRTRNEKQKIKKKQKDGIFKKKKGHWETGTLVSLQVNKNGEISRFNYTFFSRTNKSLYICWYRKVIGSIPQLSIFSPFGSETYLPALTGYLDFIGSHFCGLTMKTRQKLLLLAVRRKLLSQLKWTQKYELSR